MKQLSIIAVILITISTQSFAQRGWELGGYIGSSFYFGDLNTEFRLNKPRPAFGIVGRRNFNTRVCASMSLNYSRVAANDEDSSNSFENMRNLSFFGNVIDLSTVIEFNFFNYVHGDKNEWFTPYMFAGFGVLNCNPKAELNGVSYSLRDLGTEGQSVGNEYGTITTSFVAGIGLKWDINYEYSFNLHLRANRVLSDHFDDVSGTYPDLNQLESRRGIEAAQLSDRSGIDGFASIGRQRGDSRNRDTYIVIGIGIMKYFGYLPCPAISDHK